ncbi:dehydratase [Oceanicola sp. 22II-s10i]|uniref:MaoC family dehydratase n=1 Tax=Oceanicola sp. 22II-s10i TaxID=1317116 RepID=UPI000B528724|nr:MaoC family dehydratase [Oceanicola sp. 22II-s10i]OWU84185.1 dehydratase [Oceanicola sp. 22II-s10i]
MSEDIVNRLKSEATYWTRGNRYGDFHEGLHFDHHWGRTITEGDNTLFTVLTMHYNPRYTNAEAARAEGHDTTPVNPLLVFNTVFGLTVEDCSEGGGPFLGVDDLVYGAPVYPGDTVYATSDTVDCRESEKRPAFGIVTWATRGVNQRGEEVIRFRRTNLVRKER